MDNDKTMFAAGCFWGIEDYFSKITGVISTKVGTSMEILDSKSLLNTYEPEELSNKIIHLLEENLNHWQI